MCSMLSENQFAISDCHIALHLELHEQLLCSSQFYKFDGPLSADAIFIFISPFLVSTRL